MTNAEKYKDAIIRQMCETGDWAVDKNTGEIINCLYCAKCLFCNDCYETKIEWLVSEYKERKEFTDDERKFIELLDKAEWVARDYDNTLGIFSQKPSHNEISGRWASYGEHFCLTAITSLPFAAIKSTDTEPTSRAEILGEEK